MTLADSILMGTGSGPAALRFQQGEAVVALVCGELQEYPVKEIGRDRKPTGAFKKYPSGDTIMAVKAPVYVEALAVGDDDGMRTLYLEKQHLRIAVVGAVRTAGRPTLEIGARLRIVRGPDNADNSHSFTAELQAPTPDSIAEAKAKSPSAATTTLMGAAPAATPAPAPAAAASGWPAPDFGQSSSPSPW